MTNQNYAENDPRHHTTNVKDKHDDLINHLREGTGKINAPKFCSV